LSSLLLPEKLLDSSWVSLGVHLYSVCAEDVSCDRSSIELKQTLSAVYDPIHAGVAKKWSMSRLFGKALSSACPLAQKSNIFVDITTPLGVHTVLKPEPNIVKKYSFGMKEFEFAVYNLKEISNGLDISIDYQKKLTSSLVNSPFLVAKRYLTKYGEEMGGLVCKITNKHPSEEINLVYYDVIPYFIRVYVHTLKILLNGVSYRPPKMIFIPGKGRLRPSSIEILIKLPPQSEVVISVDFEKVLLDWTSHPPDSHHGFYLPSAIISTILPDAQNMSGHLDSFSRETTHPVTTCGDRKELFTRIYTEALLVFVATPDFSMPYNVICLSCTVIAIAFGTIFNLATRNFVVESLEKKEEDTMKAKAMKFVRKLFKKSAPSKEEVSSNEPSVDPVQEEKICEIDDAK
jgi:phosphatidylinositol glycan class T